MADNNLWSSILGTAGSLIGLGTQQLSNDAAKIKADADTQLLRLQNEGLLAGQAYQKAILQIQTDRDTKLSEITLKAREQQYGIIGMLVGVVAIAAIVIVLVLRSSKP